MKIAFYGSSLLSSYWNGAATYYRGLLRALAGRGHAISFYEPDAFGRQAHRDIDPPAWCRSVVYAASEPALTTAAAEAGRADVVVKASGVGYADDVLPEMLAQAARPDALFVFWDVDAPATLAELKADPGHPLRRMLPRFDLVFTYGGGAPVVDAYRSLGARHCEPVYNALDPQTHHPVEANPRFACDLGFLGNRLPDREERVRRFLFDAALRRPEAQFLLGGAGWSEGDGPANIRLLGHVGTADHNAFNVTPKAVLNVSRESMAANGWSPATRVFEAAGAGACLISDDWEGIGDFLSPGREVLVARDGLDVAELLSGLTREDASAMGRRALARVLAEHTYDRRALQVDARLAQAAAAKASAGVAA